MYSIRALIFIAHKRTDSYISIHEISESLHISFHFLTKNLQILIKANIIKSARGTAGNR
ncbi:Rrf2 family transcriptional regulator [candidate division KSB1 bacterium]